MKAYKSWTDLLLFLAAAAAVSAMAGILFVVLRPLVLLRDAVRGTRVRRVRSAPAR